MEALKNTVIPLTYGQDMEDGFVFCQPKLLEQHARLYVKKSAKKVSHLLPTPRICYIVVETTC